MPEYAPKKLDIASGAKPGAFLKDKKTGGYVIGRDGQPKVEEGWTGIDLMPGSDIEWDLWNYPWPIKTGSVSKVNIRHFVEHIPHYRPEWGAKDGWFMFWEEVYRITRKNATVEVIHPYAMSDRAFWDPTHVRFIVPQSWFYLDSRWREANDLSHYTTADFDVQVAYAGIADDMQGRTEEYVEFHRNHSWNIVPDLSVTLTRR